MKHNVKYIGWLFASAGLLAATGCASHGSVTVTPATSVLMPDSSDMAGLDVELHIPDHYFSRRSRLVITPQLVVGDTVVEEYTPLVLDAPIYSKKQRRKEVLHGYIDPYAPRAVKVAGSSKAFDVVYKDSVMIPQGIDNARIVGVVSTDGCGQCTGIETIDLAGISVPATLIDIKEEINLTWIEPEFKIRPKIHNGRGEARLQFVVNNSDINVNLANNRSELTEMIETLRPILQDSLATLTSLNIYGSASAEGSYQHNKMLAGKRADSAKGWLTSQLGLPGNVQRIIKTGVRPEGWEPVVAAMHAANDPDSAKVREIMLRYPGPTDDAAEIYIRQLPCWPRIKSNYLAKDRKVVYEYTWTIKSFTNDAELLEMYEKRPDAFNEEEMLRVSTLAPDDESRIGVYETILKYFPASQTAANNLAILYLKSDRTDDARRVLESQKEFSPEILNTLAASYVFADDYERAIELLTDVELPQARYNLGLLKAKQRKLEEAYALLRPYADVNSAIAALSVNKNDEARQILDEVKENSPVAEYVRAIVAARADDEPDFYNHIGNAVADDRLRRRAVDEIDFRKYGDDMKFKNIIQGYQED